MSTASEVDYRTPVDDPRIAAELAKIIRSRRSDLLIMAARQLAMLAEAAKKIDRLQDEARRAGWGREAAEKKAAEAAAEQSRETVAAAHARQAMRLARQILLPSPAVTAGWPKQEVVGERDQRYQTERQVAGYLRGVIDAAAAVLDAAT